MMNLDSTTVALEYSPREETFARNSTPKLLPPSTSSLPSHQGSAESITNNKHKRSHSKIRLPIQQLLIYNNTNNIVAPPLSSQHHHQLAYPYNYPLHQQHFYHQTLPHNHHHMSAFPSQQQPSPFGAAASATSKPSNNPNDPFNRKRQRKIAVAGAFSGQESIWNQQQQQQQQQQANLTMGRKSTAQPRPVLNIPPRGIGPIVDPNENDVLCGRGGRINSHSGNIKFRDVINNRKKEYLAPTTKKLEKAHIAAAIVNDIRGMDPPGRFLKEDRDTGLWFDIGDAKAIKKTGQALREDAPDIRPELGDDSSGDEKGRSPKASGKKSPMASPMAQQEPNKVTSAVAATPAAAIWPQSKSNNNNHRQPQQHDYHGQMAMPPPSSFETRNIPIAPPQQQQQQQQQVRHNNFYQLPNQLYSGARSVSKHAMAALTPNNFGTQRPPDDIAFGRHFHPPDAPQSVLSSANTMSTISGLSENLSSNLSGGNDFRPNVLMNMSLKSSGVATNSLRLSSLGLRNSTSPNNKNHDSNESSMRLSAISSIRGGFNGDSLPRSFSYNDMESIVDGDNWKAIMEAEDNMIDQTAAKSILPGKHLLSSGHSINRMPGMSGPTLHSSDMSIGGLSMDLQSNASSTQWLQAAGLGGPPPPLAHQHMADDRTCMSNMSAELDALDLASMADRSYRM